MFTYDFTNAPTLSSVRLLIADTDAANPIFSDEEVNQALYLESSQAIYASGGGGVVNVPQVYSPYRAAALLLDAIAANKSRLAAIAQLLDVKLAPEKAAQALRDQAKGYREVEANAGHFAISEMQNDPFSARERVVKQFLRLAA